MFKCYLAGYIHGDVIDKCIGWRKKIREHYTSYPIQWLDPLNGKSLTSIDKDGLKSDTPPHAIVHRDYCAVTTSNLIVANMETFNTSRGMCGTFCELAWAWEHHIPIIMITDEKKYKEHPFLSYFASVIVSSVDELLEKKYINYFYKGLVNAQY